MTEQAIVSLKEYARSPEIVERFAEVVGKSNANAYISSVVLAVNASPSLAKCDVKSIVSTALRAATMRLSCDPGVGHAYPVPFKGRATLVIGYKGLIHMAERTGKYRYINAGPVYEGEEYIEDRITGHARIDGSKTSKEVIGYVASFQLLSGFSKTIYMTVDEIHEHANKYSKSYGMSDSAWKTNAKDMERKTILRRLLTQWGYLDPSDTMMMVGTTGDEDVIEGEAIDEYYNLPNPDEVTHIEALHIEAPPPSMNEVFDMPPDEPKKEVPGFDVKAYVTEHAQKCQPPTSKASQQLAAILDGMLGGSPSRYEFMSYLAGKSVKTSKDIDQRMITALYEWLDPQYDKLQGRFFTANDEAQLQITHAHQEYLKTIGQLELV